jgi:PhoPQ-activated pathogenicity-related protein
MKALLAIEDPYSYRDRLTMPKLILSASGDQFFLPDSWQFYYGALKGEKQLRYVPNADHSLKSTDGQQTLAAFYDSVVHDRPRPRFEWGIEKDGTIRVKTIDTPSEVRLWQATNPNARDFRLEEIGPAYQSSVLAEQGGGVYVAKIPKPEKGFTAAFVELTYPAGGKYPLKLTTGVKVIPDVYPFPAYQPAPVR